MHIPDGFLSPPVWLALDAISLPAVGWAARRASAAGDGEHRIPLWGVMGAFVFAAQMINFPVGPAASGHLLGGALLAIVLGPAAAAVVMTAILVLQALRQMRDLARAMWLAVELETLARQYVIAVQTGTPVILDDAEIERVRRAFAGYGLRPAAQASEE